MLIVAASYQQGRVCFDHILAFMADKLADKRQWRVQDTMQVAIRHPPANRCQCSRARKRST